MAAQSLSVEAVFDQIFDRALRSQPQIHDIVLASEQGLVIAYKSRAKGKEQRLAALAPVVNDAGEAMFNELALAPLGELILIGVEGTAYQVRLKAAPAFLLLAAKGQVNIGLLRMVANQIELEAGQVLQALMR